MKQPPVGSENGVKCHTRSAESTLYGPEQAYFDQTFPMSKIEKVK